MRMFRSIPVLVACWTWTSSDLPAGEVPPGRGAVGAALTAVDRWLANGPHAEAWQKRLELGELRREVGRNGSPDLPTLQRWLERLTAEGRITAHAPVIALRRSVEGWLALESLPHGRYLPVVTASILQSPAAREGASRAELRQQLIALAAMLSRYAEEPSDDLAQSIDDVLGRLATAGQAEGLVDAVRHYYGQPNVWIDISEELLDDPVVRMIERTEAVHDMILGTATSGKGRLRAQSDLLIEPAANRAIFKIVVHGQIDAQTTGWRDPARIHSRSTTTFRAEKQLLIEPTGLKGLPTVCRAQMSAASSHVSATSAGLRGRIVRRVAERRWQASRDAAHREAERHVEQRVCATVDREADELIARLDRFVIRPMLGLANQGPTKPPKQFGPPQQFSTVRFSTDKGILRIGLRRGPLGAPCEPPPVDDGRLLAVRLHSSLIGGTEGTPLAYLAVPLRWEKLAFFTPLGALKGVESVLLQPGRVLQASFGSASPSPSSLVSGRLWRALAWRWINQTVAPRLDAGGIVLRDGRWGTLTPGGFGADWPFVAWQPAPAAEAADQELSGRLIGLVR